MLVHVLFLLLYMILMFRLLLNRTIVESRKLKSGYGMIRSFLLMLVGLVELGVLGPSMLRSVLAMVVGMRVLGLVGAGGGCKIGKHLPTRRSRSANAVRVRMHKRGQSEDRSEEEKTKKNVQHERKAGV